METHKKRKTHTSNEVSQRYKKKTYCKFTVNLRKVEDADLIALFESNKEQGIMPTDTVRQLFETANEKTPPAR